jgi:hypothetical protein
MMSVLLGFLSACSLLQPAPTRRPYPTSTRAPTRTPTTTPLPLPADQILTVSTNNTMVATSLKFSMTSSIQENDTAIMVTGNGIMVPPDQFDFNLNYGGDAIEILRLGPTESYFRFPGEQSWTDVSGEIGSYIVTTPIEQFRLRDLAENLVKLDNEDVDGINCFHIRFDMNMNEYFKMIESKNSGEANDFSGVIDIWAGKDDLLFRQTVIEVKYEVSGYTLKFKEKWKFYDYNEPVELPKP